MTLAGAGCTPHAVEYQGFPTAEEQIARQTSEPDMLRALAFGLVAALVGAGIWYGIVVTTQYEVGFVAILIGWLVGRAVVLGSGGKRGLRLQGLSVAIALAAMAGAYYFSLQHAVVGYVTETYGAAAAATVPLFLPLDATADVMTSSLQDDPIELVFWAIAIYAAFRVPAVAKVPAARAEAPSTS